LAAGRARTPAAPPEHHPPRRAGVPPPPPAWSTAPAGTKGFALVCDDPDAPVGTWVHWVLYGLPPTASTLPTGVPPKPTLGDGSRQGTNDFKKTGYGGPCPPRGGAAPVLLQRDARDTSLSLAPT